MTLLTTAFVLWAFRAGPLGRAETRGGFEALRGTRGTAGRARLRVVRAGGVVRVVRRGGTGEHRTVAVLPVAAVVARIAGERHRADL